MDKISEDPRLDRISEEELRLINDLKSKAVLAVSQAERAAAVARIQELEVKNLVLTIYNKYNLVWGVDAIQENGQIVRKTQEAIKEETNG